MGRRTLLKAGLAAAVAATPLGILIQQQRDNAAVAQADPPGSRLVIPGLAGDGPPPPISLREKIGRMVLTGFRGTAITEGMPVRRDIVDRHLGGVILFDFDTPTGGPRNIESPAQLRTLTTQLHSLRTQPLLIGVDQEGGAVARLSPKHGFPATISAADLGAQSPQATYEAAAAIADTLATAGINLNFAPVVDLNVNPDNPVIGAFGRSFSANPDVVTAHAEAFIRAHHERGILCAIKHFPGHGSSRADSHLGFVNVTDTWSSVELEPFRNLVAAGLPDIVMTAHIFNANLDPDYPATLSHSTITGLLRNQLGYKGVVISDDMGMAAIASEYGFEFAVEKAVQAGVDILLYGNNLAGYDDTVAGRIIDLIEARVQSGAVSQARIDESYARLIELDRRLVQG